MEVSTGFGIVVDQTIVARESLTSTPTHIFSLINRDLLLVVVVEEHERVASCLLLVWEH